MTRAARLAAALGLALSSPAAADVWQHATTTDATKATLDDLYAHAIEHGDDLARQANTVGISYAATKITVTAAADAYRAAAAARPDAAEPYFRIGWLLYTFYFQECNVVAASQMGPQRSVLCDPSMFNMSRARDVIDAWNAAEARAPLDPRWGSLHEANNQLLFERALLETRLEDPEHIAAAVRDYETLIARSDGVDIDDTPVIANLAETYMMLGQMDKSIDLYTDASRRAGDLSTSYGLAVALDRDERGDQARAIIADLHAAGFDDFRKAVSSGRSFYVPDGEVYYYLALASEALGEGTDAVHYWDAYIHSAAGKHFGARARVNRDALIAKLKAHPVVAPRPSELPDF